MLKAAVLALSLVVASTALAMPLSNEKQAFTSAIPLTGSLTAACDASIWNVATPACASFKLDMAGFTEATLLIKFTRGTATQLDAWVDGSMAGAVPWGRQQAGDTSATPVIAMAEQDARWTGLAASDVWMVTFKNLNAPWVRWRFYAAGSGDTIQVYLVRRGP